MCLRYGDCWPGVCERTECVSRGVGMYGGALPWWCKQGRWVLATRSIAYASRAHLTQPQRTVRTFGPLQFTVHQNIPTMDAMHNPAIAFDQSHTPGGLRRVQGIAPIDPAIDNVRCLGAACWQLQRCAVSVVATITRHHPPCAQAVQHFAAQQGALPTLRRQATQQWMSGHDAYAHGGEHFVTFGNDRRVALPLLQEALDYALKHATDEREQAELFAQCLLGGGVANLQRVPPVAKPSAVPSAPTRLPTIYDVNAPMQPLTPLAAAMSIAQAGAVPAGATAVTVAGSHKQLGANMVLGVPDFSARRRPPRSFWFPLVYGTLILGLVVVTILNIANVFT